MTKEGIDLLKDLDFRTDSDHSGCTMTVINDEDSKKWGQGTTTSMKCLFDAKALIKSIDKEYECPIELIGLNEKDNQKV